MMGFNSEEAKVYLALLRMKSATAKEIMRHARIPDSHVYKTLRGLLEKGLITVSVGRPRIYTILNPTKILAPLKNRVISELEEGYKKLLQEATNTERPPFNIFLNRRGFVYTLSEEINRANNEIRALIYEKWLLGNIVRECLNRAREGKRVHLLLREPLEIREGRELQGNIEIRYTRTAPPMNIVLIDSRKMFLSLCIKEGENFLGIEVDGNEYVKGYLEYFNHLWVEHFLEFLRRARARRLEELY